MALGEPVNIPISPDQTIVERTEEAGFGERTGRSGRSDRFLLQRVAQVACGTGPQIAAVCVPLTFGGGRFANSAGQGQPSITVCDFASEFQSFTVAFLMLCHDVPV